MLHPAAQLVRVGLETLSGLGNPDLLEELEGPIERLFLREAEMCSERLRELIADPAYRIQRGA